MNSNPIEWRRLITEGVVIVASILLAFAIDAWWDERQQADNARDQVARVLAELRANVVVLEQQVEFLGLASVEAREFLDLLGPEPEPVDLATVASRVEGIYSVPTFTLEHSASEDFLSSGELTDGHWADFRISLANTLSDVTAAERASVELRQLRTGIAERMDMHVSGLDIVLAHPLMRDYRPSRVVSDTRGLLADMRFESLLAVYAIRLEINRSQSREVLRRIEELIADVEPLIDDR